MLTETQQWVINTLKLHNLHLLADDIEAKWQLGKSAYIDRRQKVPPKVRKGVIRGNKQLSELNL